MKYLSSLLSLCLLTACVAKAPMVDEPVDDTATSSAAVSSAVSSMAMVPAEEGPVTIHPISHATMVLEWNDIAIYVDPVGGSDAFAGQPAADLVLVTDIHGDHLSIDTLAAITGSATIIAPQAVYDELTPELQAQTTVIDNGETISDADLSIEAIPMYNLPETDDSRHAKGRGNGYVLENDGYRVYISGDTADIPEMRNLTDIDLAFVCMNLPYTMDAATAADAVLEFAPATVYPYHYRQPDGFADTAAFKNIVEAGSDAITVVQLDWYAQ